MQKKYRIEKIYKEYLSVKESNPCKWSRVFFFKLFLKKDIFFLSINKPIEGYLIARKIVDEYEILSLATDIDKRRKGIGGMLLNKIINKSKKEKIKRILLEVSLKNVAAIRMYKKFGFKIIGKRINYYNQDSGLSDAYTMEKKLIKYVE